MAGEELEAYVLKLAAFHGAQAVTSAKWGDTLEEEFITGALFGAIASAFPLLAFSAGLVPGHKTTLRWGQFKKSGSVATGSESKSGADFALLLCVAADDYRLALFQAKRVKNGRVDVHQIPRKTSGPARRTQLVTLWTRAAAIWHAVSAGRVAGKPDVSWTHYLAYGAAKMQCVPLSALERHYLVERRNEIAQPVSVLKQDPCFARLVARGFKKSPRGALVVGGWLRLTYQEAIGQVPLLLSTTDLYFVDRRVSGMTLTLDLVNNHPELSANHVIENIAASRIRNFRPPTGPDQKPTPAPLKNNSSPRLNPR